MHLYPHQQTSYCNASNCCLFVSLANFYSIPAKEGFFLMNRYCHRKSRLSENDSIYIRLLNYLSICIIPIKNYREIIVFIRLKNGGVDRTRTDYLSNANAALYQMSYYPTRLYYIKNFKQQQNLAGEAHEVKSFLFFDCCAPTLGLHVFVFNCARRFTPSAHQPFLYYHKQIYLQMTERADYDYI